MWPVFLSALFAHVGVNALNEYQDFLSGLDFKTTKTPFSGGSGALPQNPQAAIAVLMMAVISLVITAVLGFYLMIVQGIHLLIPGLIGLVIIVTYTHWINRKPWLCLIAPGLGFGVLMVLGSYIALTGVMDVKVALISLVPFFLVNNLLLLNQYPDIEADKQVGRFHFPIRYGIKISNMIYLIFLIAAMLVISFLMVFHQLPPFGWIAILPLFAGLFTYFGAEKYRQDIGRQPQLLAINVVVTLLTPAILSAVIYFS